MLVLAAFGRGYSLWSAASSTLCGIQIKSCMRQATVTGLCESGRRYYVVDAVFYGVSSFLSTLQDGG